MPLQYHGQAMRRTLVEIEFVRDLTQRQARALTGKHVKNCQRPIQHLDLVGRLGRCLIMWHDVALYERLMQCQQKFYRGIGSVFNSRRGFTSECRATLATMQNPDNARSQPIWFPSSPGVVCSERVICRA